jgi:shikimate kinase
VLERKLTEELRDVGNMVVAPGGGWAADPSVVALVRPPAKLIYLRVRPETALSRLGSAVASRPLLSRPDPAAEMRRIFEARRIQYQGSDLEIGAELLSPQQVIDEILRRLGPVAAKG